MPALPFIAHRGVGKKGVDVIVHEGDPAWRNGRFGHPWAPDAEVNARAGDAMRVMLPYPDEATRAEAAAARNGDWEETVNPEAAALWRTMGGDRKTTAGAAAPAQ